jgi:hypothetical protein
MISVAFSDYYNNNNIGHIPIQISKSDIEKIAKMFLDKTSSQIRDIVIPLIGDYSDSLISQINQEIERLDHGKNKVFRAEPLKVIEFLIGLAFNPLYQGDINRIYTKDNLKPSQGEISKSISIIYRICLEASTFMKKSNKKAKIITDPKYEQVTFGAQKQKQLIKADPNSDEKITIDDYIEKLDETLSDLFPAVEGDPIIQIGTTVQKYGDPDCVLKHIITLDGCSDITNETLVMDENKDTVYPVAELAKELVGLELPAYLDSLLGEKVVELENLDDSEIQNEKIKVQISDDISLSDLAQRLIDLDKKSIRRISTGKSDNPSDQT